jgi:apolipoprotein N-acyltransferase
VLAEQRSDAQPFSELAAEARVARDSTIYARWGDWFAWSCLGALAAIVVPIAFSRPRPRPERLA